MSIPHDGEEKPLTLSKLAASAEECDRQKKLASKVSGGANQARAKRSEVSEKDLLSKYGGKKAGSDIIFGSEGETQLIFRPSKGWMDKLADRWTVCLRPIPISGYDTQRELSKGGGRLWNKEKGELSVAFKAVEQLLACHVEELRAPRVEVRKLHELGERPPIEAVMEQLSIVGERLNRVSEQLLGAQDAISLVVEALSKELGGKLQIAFDMLRDDSQWPQEALKLRFHALDLARELQRPPTKAELRKRFNSKRYQPLEESKFSPLLQHAGLLWLEKGRRLKIP